jgi:hypothetical protein
MQASIPFLCQPSRDSGRILLADEELPHDSAGLAERVAAVTCMLGQHLTDTWLQRSCAKLTRASVYVTSLIKFSEEIDGLLSEMGSWSLARDEGPLEPGVYIHVYFGFFCSFSEIHASRGRRSCSIELTLPMLLRILLLTVSEHPLNI